MEEWQVRLNHQLNLKRSAEYILIRKKCRSAKTGIVVNSPNLCCKKCFKISEEN